MKSGLYGTPSVVGQDAQYDLMLAGSNDLTISGGWSGTTCTTQSIGAGLTVMDGGLQRRIFDFGVSGAGIAATVRISNLTLYRGLTTGDVGGCLRFQGYQGIGANLYIERVVFQQCEAAQRGGGLAAMVQAGRIEITGNRFVFNEANSESAVYLNNSFGNTHFINNSVIGNTTRSASWPALTDICVQPNYCLVANNVFWDNQDVNGQNRDMSLVGGISLHNNRFDEYSGVPTSQSNNISSHPGYVSANDFAVHADSPLRNAGRINFNVNIPNIDILGVPRPAGSNIDIGADEYNEPVLPMFANHFE